MIQKIGNGKSRVLNLVINGIPSIQKGGIVMKLYNFVLNLVINGIPSILSLNPLIVSFTGTF